MAPELHVPILPQPDDVTCGPTCLQAVYGYWGDDLPLGRVIAEVARIDNGGTLGVLLGCHALRRGYAATLYTYNLEVFDPTWFRRGIDLPAKLRAQAGVKPNPRLQAASRGYLEFLGLGGKIRYQDLTPALLRRVLKEGTPILTGLSATHLYRGSREVDRDGRLVYDDVAGEPTGHFVILSSWDPKTRRIGVADPLRDNPAYPGHQYRADAGRVMSAILLGSLTYDANFLVIRP